MKKVDVEEFFGRERVCPRCGNSWAYAQEADEEKEDLLCYNCDTEEDDEVVF